MTEGTFTSYATAVDALNQRQREALRETGNTVVLAGPGSGKTATLVLKIATLLDQIKAPRGVACLTYGNEAAREFEARLARLGVRTGGRLFTGTVHSFCLTNVLRPFARRLPTELAQLAEFDIATDDDAAHARQEGLDAAGVNESEAWWRAKVSAFRQTMAVATERQDEFDERLPAIVGGYEAGLRKRRRLDFDDIIIVALRLIERDSHVRAVLGAKYPWLVVDEYQDLGLPLHKIVLSLMKTGVRIFAVGDPDQSIYGFAGARPEYLDALAKRTDVASVRLGLNYRCHQSIIDASLHVLQPAEARGFKAAKEGNPGEGELVFHRCPEGLGQQASTAVGRIRALIDGGLAPGEVGVLAPRWQDLKEFEEQLTADGIAYRALRSRTYKPTPLTMWVESAAEWCAGGWRVGRPRLADLFATWDRIAIACRSGSHDERTLRRRIALHSALRSLRDPSLEVGAWLAKLDPVVGLTDIATSAERVPPRVRHDVRELAQLLATLKSARLPLDEFSGLAKNKVVLQSIHGSKGLEYTAIFLPALENGVLPRWGEDERETRRLFYVAITRARREVHLLWSGFFFTAKGDRRNKGPSPFLKELARRAAAGD
jgi:DNA helicase-2/ATP-dependent DNA helicase PcrA